MSQLIFLDNQFHREEQLLIGVNNRGFRYGDGLFETIRCRSEEMQLADFHFDRLFRGMQLLGFEPPSFMTGPYIAGKLHQLLHRNGHHGPARARLTVFRGDGGPFDAVSSFPHLLLQSWPLAGNEALNENGLVLGIHERTRKAIDELSGCKTNNYLSPLMAAREAKLNHWNDAVIRNSAGRICETAVANIFFWINGRLVTPALTEGPVAGTMRRYIVTEARRLHTPVEERAVTEDDMAAADEMFTTNAIQGIRWVAALGDKKFQSEKTVTLFRQVIQPLWQG